MLKTLEVVIWGSQFECREKKVTGKKSHGKKSQIWVGKKVTGKKSQKSIIGFSLYLMPGMKFIIFTNTVIYINI